MIGILTNARIQSCIRVLPGVGIFIGLMIGPPPTAGIRHGILQRFIL